jgi:hypothetical protein
MGEDDPRFVVELLRIVKRDVSDGFESVREELKRIREGIERLALDHEDTAQRVAVLEQSARRRAGKK